MRPGRRENRILRRPPQPAWLAADARKSSAIRQAPKRGYVSLASSRRMMIQAVRSARGWWWPPKKWYPRLLTQKPTWGDAELGKSVSRAAPLHFFGHKPLRTALPRLSWEATVLLPKSAPRNPCRWARYSMGSLPLSFKATRVTMGGVLSHC
jgi:hypothetical protein